MKFAHLILKNVLRNKLRSMLTIASLAGSLALIVLLATVLTELARGSETANPLRLISRHAVSLGFDMPIAYRDRIAALPGVKVALPYCWYGGIYKDESNFFANFAVDPKLLRDYQPETKMPEEAWEAFLKDRQGAIVGAKLVKLYGFAPGQRVTLKSPIFRNEIEVVVRGVYTGGDEKVLFFHHEYFNEANPEWAKDRAGTFAIMAASVDDVPKVAQAVDAMTVNTDAPTKTETEREFAISFETMMGGVKQFMYGIMGAVAFSLLLMTANAMAMSVRERTREVGTLKALGFQRGTIAWLFVGEALVLTLVGATLGIGAVWLLCVSFDVSLVVPFFIQFVPSPATLAFTFLAAVAIGVLSVTYSAFRVANLTIAEALRRVE
jgi:putative ABC transport system permease protein